MSHSFELEGTHPPEAHAPGFRARRGLNWGSIGLCHVKPELNVKPSFVSVATMTRVLDGAKFVRVVPM